MNQIQIAGGIGMINQLINSFSLRSSIDNRKQSANLRAYEVSGVKCTKLKSGIQFYKVSTGEKITIPYSQAKDFVMAVLESYADFFLKGEIEIKVDVNWKENK